MSHPKPGKNTGIAMDAKVSLYMWGAISDLLEGGSAAHCSQAAVRRVLSIAKAEQQKELRRMDAAVAKINEGKS